ncbi:DUF2254 domain-containing protein [Methylocystis echinoides]|uniref:DUF2254 domain-containing protein n=1 Tax=Methylocystis echinoides TaxID=29468 RepID=UPI00341BDFC9
MRETLLAFWERLRANFWFVPSLMALATAGFSYGVTRIDANRPVHDLMGWLWSGGADGARSLLSTIASSMITVAGTVFSITIAALTLAGSQFGWRLLRNFTRDLGNQIVLGTFVSTFLYCLLILRTVRSEDEGGFVPHVSVTCAVVFAVASVGVLIYFIDHMARSIQAESLIAAIGADLRETIRALRNSSDEEVLVGPPAVDGPMDSVLAEESGYLEHLNHDRLVEFAERKSLLIESCLGPGDFVMRGSELFKVHGAVSLNRHEQKELREATKLDCRRTPTQDLRFGVRQLTEIAVRALSPGINDPYTAMTCADWLADCLGELGCKQNVLLCRFGPSGEPRLLERTVSFEEVTNLSFDSFRIYGAESLIVMIHLLNLLTRLGLHVQEEYCRAVLRQHSKAAAEVALAACRGQWDRERLEAAATRARSVLAE